MKNINLQLDPLQIEGLDYLTSQWQMSRSELIRNMVYTVIKLVKEGTLKLDIAPACSPTLEQLSNSIRFREGKYVTVDAWGLVTGELPRAEGASIKAPPPKPTDVP